MVSSALGLLETFTRSISFHFVLQSQKMVAEEIYFLLNYMIFSFHKTKLTVLNLGHYVLASSAKSSADRQNFF